MVKVAADQDGGVSMATDTLTGGPTTSPTDWSTTADWSSGLPTTSDVVDATGFSTLNTTNAASPLTEELIAGLSLASGANLNIGASTLEVSGSGSTTFGGAGSTIEIAGGQLTVDSAVIAASGAVDITSGGYIYNGSHSTQNVTVSGGLFDVGGSNNSATVNLSGSGKLFLDATGNDLTVNMTGGQLEVESTSNTGVVNLLGNGQLIFNGAVAFNGALGELGAGHTLEVENQGSETAHSFTTDTASNSITLDFTAGATTLSYTLNFDPATDPLSNLSVTISNGAFDITAAATVCFVTGSRIRTVRGDVAVERLKVGDLALTSQGEARPIVWIGHRTVRGPVRAQWPVKVAAGAFGAAGPTRDLMLSPGHAVCVNVLGEVFIPIDHLINGATIAQVEVSEVTYWHVELESHDVLLAEGLGCESYMDSGNRAFFGREYGRLARVDPARVAESLNRYARPFVDGGPIVTSVATRLVELAKAQGWELECDPDIHLLADGRRVEPQANAGSARFIVPASATSVELRSRVFVPAQVDCSADTRPLGIALLGLRVGETAISLDDPRIADGFHADERSDGAGWRWTDGRLVLPTDLWAGRAEDVELAVDFIADAFRSWRKARSRRAA